jgi:hypothetical protein
MTRGKSIMGIFCQNEFFFKGFDSFGGQSLSLSSLGDYLENDW